MLNKYYVYGLVDPRDNKIKYIGKGSGNRMFIHVQSLTWKKYRDSNYTKIKALKEILTEYDDIAYCKLFETGDEALAYEKESELIKEYNSHVSKNGWNLTYGGENPPSNKGRKHSEETILRMSLSQQSRSKETREKISESKRGEKHPNYGKSPWNKNKCASDVSKQRMSESAKGNKNRLGKKTSDITKHRLSELNKGKRIPDDVRQKISESGKLAWKKRKEMLEMGK